MKGGKRHLVDVCDVNLDEPCQVCRRTEPTHGNDMLACDGCNYCYHQLCLSPKIQGAIPEGAWLCPECARHAARVATAQGKAADPSHRARAEEPTYEVARPPRLNKATRREAAGLVAGTRPTMATVQLLKAAALAPSTQLKHASVRRSVQRFADKYDYDIKQDGFFELYVCHRVQDGLAEQTILDDMSIMKTIEGVKVPPDKEVKKLAQAVRRLAEAPGERKDPITANEMRLLRDQLMADWRDDGSEDSVRRLRNWTHMLLSFVGMLRPGEAINLQWEHVQLGWKEKTPHAVAQDYSIDARPADHDLVHATLWLCESKTDPGARGQLVRVAAGHAHGLKDDPVRLLMLLRRHARPGQLHVFSEVRHALHPAGLCTKTMTNTLNTTLEAAGVSRDRRERLSLHSFRRGGATAALASGETIRAIKTHGRWRSDVAYIYALASDQQAIGVSKTLLGTVGQALRELALQEDEADD